MSKQLAFKQSKGQRSAIHRDERSPRSVTFEMNPVSHELFPGTAFTANEHGGVRFAD